MPYWLRRCSLLVLALPWLVGLCFVTALIPLNWVVTGNTRDWDDWFWNWTNRVLDWADPALKE